MPPVDRKNKGVNRQAQTDRHYDYNTPRLLRGKNKMHHEEQINLIYERSLFSVVKYDMQVIRSSFMVYPQLI